MTENTHNSSTSLESPAGSVQRRKRPWSVTAVGILLILQAIFFLLVFPVLVGIEIYNQPEARLSWLFFGDGSLVPPQIEVVDISKLEFLLDFSTMRVLIPGRVFTSLAFYFLALPLLVTGFLFLRLWRHAWTLAVLLEGLLLAFSLVVYFNFNHPYVYPLMISGIFMIFYLNYYEVQLTFQNRFGLYKK